MPWAAQRPSSKNSFGSSRSFSTRSRAVRRPFSCWRSVALGPPPRRRSASVRLKFSVSSRRGLIAGEAGAGRAPGVVVSAWVPNEQGMRGALTVNEKTGKRVIDKVAVFTAASETFSHKNTNAGIAETLKRFEPVAALAKEHGLLLRGYV